MTHKELLQKYKEISKTKDEDIVVYFASGKHSIRIRPVKGVEFVFTYYDDKRWCLETIDRYLEFINERRKR